MSYYIDFDNNKIIYKNDTKIADCKEVFRTFSDAKRFSLKLTSLLLKKVKKSQKAFLSMKSGDVKQ